jgi:hypothetical protein
MRKIKYGDQNCAFCKLNLLHDENLVNQIISNRICLIREKVHAPFI